MPTPTPPKRRGLWSYLFGKSPAAAAHAAEEEARKSASSQADNASPVHSRTSSACYVPELVGAESLVFTSLILTQPHATTLMAHLPESLRMQNFKLAYSMLNDGSDMSSFYKKAQPHKNTILLIQTTDGAILGCFTASAWHEESAYYGTGVSLMFRFKHQSADDIDVYTWTGKNTLFQYSTQAKIAVGGGGEGFGIVLDKDFSTCASYPCDTYGNTVSLASLEADSPATCGVSNVELWSFRL